MSTITINLEDLRLNFINDEQGNASDELLKHCFKHYSIRLPYETNSISGELNFPRYEVGDSFMFYVYGCINNDEKGCIKFIGHDWSARIEQDKRTIKFAFNSPDETIKSLFIVPFHFHKTVAQSIQVKYDEFDYVIKFAEAY